MKSKIFTAESINDWFREDYFRDLVTFETQVANLASVIVLFVESPGSIAELASFSQVPQIRERLLVFLDEHFYNKDSFIRKGPIQYLEDQGNDLVHVYPWSSNNSASGTNFETSLLKDFADDIANDINAKVKEMPNEETFSEFNETHLTLLVCDIIRIARLLKIGEILEMMKKMGADVEQKDIRKYLFILEKLGLVERVPYKNHRYFRCRSNASFISYGFKPTAKFNEMTRWKFRIHKWFRENDTDRFKVIQSNQASTDE